MTFLHGTLFLAGVGCVSIPILIHLLLRQRRKPIAWAAMRFLLEAYRKQRRRLRLQHLILLATRCLALALLAAALARPILDGAGLGGVGGRSVFVLIDNSLAASAREDVARNGGGGGGGGEGWRWIGTRRRRRRSWRRSGRGTRWVSSLWRDRRSHWLCRRRRMWRRWAR